MASKSNRAVLEPEIEKNGHSTELQLSLYRMLMKCRMCDEKARVLFKQNKFAGGNFYSAVGQEATEVGTAISLRADDWVAPSHRDWTANIIKGVPLKFCFAQLYAKATSPDRGRSSPAHMGYPPLNIITPASSIAGQLNVGTGVALGLKRLGRDTVVVAYFGDGATSIGGFHEALNLAGVHRLPIIYVCQNNLWAESVPLRLQTALTDLSQRAVAYGFPGVSVDGNDVLAVYDVAQTAIARARSGEGPTLIECKTYRWYGHSEIDPARYRMKEEVEAWKKKCPVQRFEKALFEKKTLTDAKKKEVTDEITREINEAVDFAEQSPYPDASELMDHIWA
ncbi:MAG TPA: thiamine pyrophosphate-dependent dehydrogenase E1 component subunit alpha [Candidatus Acidoferrales bacterium]|nr:thiamine pyrophosphate-dependent dehydrogenase E1 component subunit alpha [Candidatus Acidoferrales bacterium]